MSSTDKLRKAGQRQEAYWQQERIDLGIDPDEETIEKMCCEIRKGWTPHTERSRRATGFYVPAELAKVTVPRFTGRSSSDY